MFFGHAELLHDLQRLGQRGFAAGGRERDHERLLDRAQEREERHANQDRHAADDDDGENDQAAVHQQHQLAEREKNPEAHLADRGGRWPP